MARIIAALSMSLDGFIVGQDGDVGPLFDWYMNGEVETRWPGMGLVSRTSPASAAYLRDTIASAGALVVGRRVFDYTRGWGGGREQISRGPERTEREVMSLSNPALQRDGRVGRLPRRRGLTLAASAPVVRSELIVGTDC